MLNGGGHERAARERTGASVQTAGTLVDSSDGVCRARIREPFRIGGRYFMGGSSLVLKMS
jgi:hypothetical protein